MATTNEVILRGAAATLRRLYEMLQAGADPDDLLDDKTLWPLTQLREAVERS